MFSILLCYTFNLCFCISIFITLLTIHIGRIVITPELSYHRFQYPIFVFKNLQLDREVEKQAGQADKLSVENIQLKARLDELEVENKHLEDGIRELRDAIQDPGDNHVLEVPVLDKLLAVCINNP